MKDFICCICGCNCTGYGNNPDGACWLDPDTSKIVEGKFEVSDYCCDECNSKYVIPGRIYLMNKMKNKPED